MSGRETQRCIFPLRSDVRLPLLRPIKHKHNGCTLKQACPEASPENREGLRYIPLWGLSQTVDCFCLFAGCLHRVEHARPLVQRYMCIGGPVQVRFAREPDGMSYPAKCLVNRHPQCLVPKRLATSPRTHTVDWSQTACMECGRRHGKFGARHPGAAVIRPLTLLVGPGSDAGSRLKLPAYSSHCTIGCYVAQ